MKKISKKILAMVTMAAFVVTLLPVAAFAAPGDLQTSYFAVVKNGEAQTEVPADVNDELTAQFFVRDNHGYGTTDALQNSADVRIWASDVTNPDSVIPASTALTVKTGSGFHVDGTDPLGAYELQSGATVNDGDYVTISFSRAGTYVLHAGVATSGATSVDDYTKLPGTTTTITVSPESVDTATVDLALVNTDLTSTDTLTGIVDGGKVTVTPTNSFLLNGLQDTTITATAKQQGGKAAMNEKFTFRSSGSGLVLDKTEDTTDAYGNFDITFSINKADTYRIWVTGDDVAFTIEVNAENTTADSIVAIADNAQPMLAGDDKNFSDNYSATDYKLDDAVQFEITDKSGNVIEDTLSGEPAQTTTDPQHKNYMKVTAAEGSSLESGDLQLAWSTAKEAYTLQYVGNDAEKDLVPGEYTVSVGLESGDVVTVSFTLANYGTTQDVVVDLTLNGVEVTDEVVLPDTITPTTGTEGDLVATAKYVDENGIKIKVKDNSVQYGFNGKAVNTTASATEANNTAILKTANENLLGTTITVTAIDDSIPVMKVVALTVVEDYGVYSLAFDGENGLVNENNKVAVSVVDENGDVVKVNGTMIAYVEDQSNDEAVVELDPGKVTNGEGTLVINSDKETTVDVAVAVKDADSDKSGAIYVGNLSYTIGGEDVNADTIVGMTIGSSDYIVNNDVVSGDAAPYIDENWRTMAPVRVINETFGATVDYKDNVITIVKGDTTVVMTVGETAYTVNDTEYTMDTAPVIRDNDRAYVPARFMAEALGYTVTTLKDANGLTAGVVFQK